MSHREEQILLLLKRFDYLTRDQINAYFKLGTVRNTNRVLNNISEYLNVIRDGYQSIYYLNRVGREYVQCNKIRKKTANVNHYIMRNSFWLYNGCPNDWQNEIKVDDGKTTIITDAFYKKLETYHFLEVDNKQMMKENRLKINRYLDLYRNRAVANQLGHFPTVVFLTTTELRRLQLKEICNDLPFVTHVFTLDDIR